MENRYFWGTTTKLQRFDYEAKHTETKPEESTSNQG